MIGQFNICSGNILVPIQSAFNDAALYMLGCIKKSINSSRCLYLIGTNKSTCAESLYLNICSFSLYGTIILYFFC